MLELLELLEAFNCLIHFYKRCVSLSLTVILQTVFDNEMLLKQVKGKALSFEKAPRDGATVTCRAMFV